MQSEKDAGVLQFENLKSFSTIQERIDAIAKDLKSKEQKFAEISPWDLAEALQIDFSDHADWSHSSWAYKSNIEDDSFAYPYAENIQFLEGEVSANRFAIIQEKALKIVNQDNTIPYEKQKNDSFLKLSKEEKQIISDKFAQENATWAFHSASMSLKASNGTDLDFEIIIGDAGIISNPKGPYQLQKGERFNFDPYFLIESGF